MESVIAVIDDREIDRDTIVTNIETYLPEIWSCINSEPPKEISTAIEWIIDNEASVVITDHRLDEQQAAAYRGTQLVAEIRKRMPSLPVFVVTAYDEDEDLLAVLGDFEYVIKRKKFAQDAKINTERMVRAGGRYIQQNSEELAKLSDLSRKVAIGTASDQDLLDIKVLQTSLGLAAGPDNIEGRSKVMSEFESEFSNIESLAKKIELFLKKKK